MRNVHLLSNALGLEDKQSEFCVVNGLLYKKHRMLDQVIYQVVLPKERRIKVMSLAHEEPFGGHLREEKTRERIKLSFVWPKRDRQILQILRKMPIESKKCGDGQSTDNSNSKRGYSLQTYDNGCG